MLFRSIFFGYSPIFTFSGLPVFPTRFYGMLALIVVSMTAYVIADICKGKPIYETLLKRLLSKQGKVANMITQKRMVVEAVIASGAPLERKAVKDVNWPDKPLLVNAVSKS